MKKAKLMKLLTAAMTVAMAAAVPMGVQASTITVPEDSGYYFGPAPSVPADQYSKIDDAMKNTIVAYVTNNGDGTETIVALDELAGNPMVLLPMTAEEQEASENGTLDWEQYFNKYLPGTAPASSSSVSSSKEGSSKSDHVHDYEWVDYTAATEDTDAVQELRCKTCGNVAAYQTIDNSAYALFLSDAAEKIANADAGAEVTLDTVKWLSLNKAVVDAFAERSDVALKITYTQNSERKALEIPAGTDLSSLLDENGYIGFSRLAEHYAVPYVYGSAQ